MHGVAAACSSTASKLFRTKCIDGITVNEKVLAHYMETTVGIVTALNPGARLREGDRARRRGLQERQGHPGDHPREEGAHRGADQGAARSGEAHESRQEEVQEVDRAAAASRCVLVGAAPRGCAARSAPATTRGDHADRRPARRRRGRRGAAEAATQSTLERVRSAATSRCGRRRRSCSTTRRSSRTPRASEQMPSRADEASSATSASCSRASSSSRRALSYTIGYMYDGPTDDLALPPDRNHGRRPRARTAACSSAAPRKGSRRTS